MSISVSGVTINAMLDDFLPPRNKEAARSPYEVPRASSMNVSEAPFRPPEEVAAEENIEEDFNETAPNGEGKPPLLKRLIDKIKNLSRKQQLILGAVVLLLVGAMLWWFVIRDKPAPPKPQQVVKQEVKEEPKPTTVASRLSGMTVPLELDKLPVTGFMIENSPDARPQAGLKDAGVVVEAVAEGGITRFLALFQTEQPEFIGPVRSVRPYYLDFLVPFDAAIAHAGGSGQALAEIAHQGIKDLDHGGNAGAYQRVSNRYAPHNLYTSRQAMIDLQTRKGWPTSNFAGFPRKAEKPSAAPTHRSIDFAISGFLYNSHYDYDPATNSYRRSQAGQGHADERSGASISPKVVIGMVVPRSNDGIYSVYQTIGSGKVYIFQDGLATEGVWEKPNRQALVKFGDANGSPIGLNPGQTWITLISSQGEVSAKP